MILGIRNYGYQNIPSVTPQEVLRQDAQKLAQETQGATQVSSLEDSASFASSNQQAPRRDAALEDISLTFRKQDDFAAIGRDSDIHSLDVDAALSDMRKDQLLQQYQYFVGSSATNASANNAPNQILQNADGIVIPKFY